MQVIVNSADTVLVTVVDWNAGKYWQDKYRTRICLAVYWRLMLLAGYRYLVLMASSVPVLEGYYTRTLLSVGLPTFWERKFCNALSCVGYVFNIIILLRWLCFQYNYIVISVDNV